MIPEQEMIDVANRLLEKTERDEIEWKETRVGAETIFGSYDFTEGRVQIRIVFVSPRAEPDHYVLSVSTDNRLVGKLVVGRDDSDAAAPLEQLHRQAERTAVKWDKALEQLREFLSSDRVLGKVPTAKAG